MNLLLATVAPVAAATWAAEKERERDEKAHTGGSCNGSARFDGVYRRRSYNDDRTHRDQ